MISRLGVPGVLGISMGLGLGVMAQNDTSAATFDPQTVQCYAADAEPAVSRAGSSIARSDTHQIAMSLASSARQATDAVLACSDEGCDPAKITSMQRAVSSYLEARRSVTTKLYRQNASTGTSLSALLNGNGEAELSQALARLYAARRLDFASFGTQRDALALLIRNPAAFRPCATTRTITTVRGYVY